MKIFLRFKQKVASLFTGGFFKLFGQSKKVKLLNDQLDVHRSKMALITQAILELDDRVNENDRATIDNAIYGLNKKIDTIQEAMLYQQKAIEQIDRELKTYSIGRIKVKTSKDTH